MCVIENNRAQHRYEIYKSGDLAGFVQYTMRDNELWVHYTQLKRRHRSEEIIEELLLHVLDDVLRSRLAIMPFCRAMRTLMDQRPEYVPLVPEPWRPRFFGQADPRRRPMDYVRFIGSPRRPSVAQDRNTLPVPLSVSRGYWAETHKRLPDPATNGVPEQFPAT